MEIDRVIKIVDELNDLSDKFSDDELRVASYLLIRYGTSTCKYYIDDSDLEKICKEIKDRETIFDEELNYNIDKILNNSDNVKDEDIKFIQICINKIEEQQNRKLNSEEIRLIKNVAPIMRLAGNEEILKI